jgi:tetratricopeptide (TPR) repeat protein
MQIRLLNYLAVAAVAMPLFSIPAFSAGDGGAGGGSTPKCSDGKVWDKIKKKCVDPQRGMIDDDSIYETGRDLAMAGRYGEAITILSLAADKSDPRILNYLGYSHRKSGRVLVGLGYYREALIQDPDYTLVREYMGEAYLQNGDVASAREQLGEIEQRCGKGCREYSLLEQQIEAYLKS